MVNGGWHCIAVMTNHRVATMWHNSFATIVTHNIYRRLFNKHFMIYPNIASTNNNGFTMDYKLSAKLTINTFIYVCHS